MRENKELLLKTLMKKYKSPPSECSLWKGVPMKYLPLMKKYFRGEMKFRPRGGTYTSYRHNCTMVDATSFAVYSLMEETHKMRGYA